MSTHFDHLGVQARANSAKLILGLVDKYQASENASKRLPVFLGGDFNSSPNDVAYKIMTAPGSDMADVSTWLPEGKRYGNRMTYTSFGGEASPSIIDFLFCNNNDMISLQTFAVLESKFDDGIYLSDHRAIIADFTIVIS
jgi:endonuclease/exonuclease/phosphatase family metal-dependent hydrolase